MKATKILMAAFLLSIFCGPALYAQQDQKPKQTRQERTVSKQTRERKSAATGAGQNSGDQTATNKQAPENRAAKRIEMMKKSLNLTDEQVLKVQEAQKQLYDDTKQNREAGKANREAMKTKRDAYDAQMKTILTPEQYQKYSEKGKNLQNNPKKGMQKKNKGNSPKGQGQLKKQPKQTAVQ